MYDCRIVAPLRAVGAALVLTLFPGCAVLVQNRYSVLGFDGWKAATPEGARAISIGLLVAVAVVSAAIGSGVTLLVQRRRQRAVSCKSESVCIKPAASREGDQPITSSTASL
jgi:hypothetical protein